MLTNLVGNALKFTEQGSVKIEVRGRREGALLALELSVVDTGIGIAPDQQRAIFQPFVQADGSSRRRFGGTGLGLAIARDLVERMGGTLALKSQPGVGSRFIITLRLPLADSDPALRPAARVDAPSVKGLRVLVAEDNAVNLMVVSRVLKRLGCEVVTVVNGQEAVEASATQTFDAVLMDCQMPVMDGLEATRAIRARETSGGRRLPIIALTADAMSGDRDRCRSAGMDDYLTKPFRPEEVAAALDACARAGAPEELASTIAAPGSGVWPRPELTTDVLRSKKR